MGDNGTRIVPNGNGLDSRVQWGLVIRLLSWGAGLIAAILAVVLSASVLRVFEMSSRIEVIGDRQLRVLERIGAIEQAMTKEDYLTHENFATWAASAERRRSIEGMAAKTDISAALRAEIDRIVKEEKR
jgi:hypothetical protein